MTTKRTPGSRSDKGPPPTKGGFGRSAGTRRPLNRLTALWFRQGRDRLPAAGCRSRPGLLPSRLQWPNQGMLAR